MSDRFVDSSPPADDSRESQSESKIRIAIGKPLLSALDTLIAAFGALAQVDGTVRPAPSRIALIEEAVRTQLRDHRALRLRGQPVPRPKKVPGPAGVGSMSRRLHAALVQEQVQLEADYPGAAISLRDIIEAGLTRVLQTYEQRLVELQHTVDVPMRGSASSPEKKMGGQRTRKATSRSRWVHIFIGKAPLGALDTYISRLKDGVRDDLAEPVPNRTELIEEAVRTQILLHRRRRQAQGRAPLPARAHGEFQQVWMSRPLHTALLEEQHILQAEHLDELEYMISLRDIAEAGINTLLPDDLKRQEMVVESRRSAKTRPSPPRWHYLHPKVLVDNDVRRALATMSPQPAPDAAATERLNLSSGGHIELLPGGSASRLSEQVESVVRQFLATRRVAERNALPLVPVPPDQMKADTVRISRELMTNLQQEARRQANVRRQRVTLKQVVRAILTHYLADQGISLSDGGRSADSRS